MHPLSEQTRKMEGKSKPLDFFSFSHTLQTVIIWNYTKSNKNSVMKTTINLEIKSF